MANREALRQLQARLAERLHAARSEGVQASWLAVEAGGGNYLLPLAQSGEIFPAAQPQPVPYTQPWFLGVVNLRGGLWGVVDLASYATGRPPQARGELARSQTRLVALNTALEVNCAFLVDRLTGLRGLDAFVASAAADADAPEWFGSRYTDPNGATWQELNLQTLSQQARFLGISA